jgi:hypothetical protein
VPATPPAVEPIWDPVLETTCAAVLVSPLELDDPVPHPLVHGDDVELEPPPV